MLRLCSFGSGSKGNCIFVQSENTSLLIDAGISAKKINGSMMLMGTEPQALRAVLLTHGHIDHVRHAVNYASQNGICLFGSSSALRSAHSYCAKIVNTAEITGNDFFIGDITISPFAVSHDVPCYGFSLLSKGTKIAVMTDLGIVTDKILDCVCDSDIVLIESNHDEQAVLDNPKYSYTLKQRILSNRGHLSNAASGEAIAKLVQSGAKQIMLAHLSENNNTPELAYETVKRVLKKYSIDDGRDCKIHMASQNDLSVILEAV